MLVYLNGPHLAREGEGRVCVDRRQAEWELELMLLFPLTLVVLFFHLNCKKVSQPY